MCVFLFRMELFLYFCKLKDKNLMLQKLFGFDAAQHKVRTEVYAGVTTFLTMAYILVVNPGIFSALEPMGMPTGAVFTATVLASVLGSLVMALYAKKPFGLAPGMGINAFFVGNGLQLAVCIDGCLHRGCPFCSSLAFQSQGVDSQCHSCRYEVGHRRGHRSLHRLYRSAELRHHHS